MQQSGKITHMTSVPYFYNAKSVPYQQSWEEPLAISIAIDSRDVVSTLSAR